MRLHTTSAGVDPRELVAGRDLVLAIHPAHGDDLAHGVLVTDVLGAEERFEIDRLALAALSDWRARCDGRLTLDGITWPVVWELELLELLNPAVMSAVALRRTLAAAGAGSIELADRDAGTQRLAEAVARSLGIPCTPAPDAGAAGLHVTPARRAPLLRRVRRGALDRVKALGVPSVLGRNSVVFRSYWPVMDVLDHMLAHGVDGARPAITVAKLPTGVRRQVRAAARGGWLGTPTPFDRARARRAAALAATRVGPDDGPHVEGIDLGPVVGPGLVELVTRRLGHDLADAASFRRGLRRRPRAILGTYDAEPTERLLVLIARELGVPTVMVCHGAYLLPQSLADLDYCDEVVLWSHWVAPPITRLDRPIHTVGYPLHHSARPTRRLPVPAERPRVVVLGQLGAPSTATIGERLTMRSYVTALEAIRERLPHATAVLRPHPAEDTATHALLLERFAGLDVVVDAASDIHEVVGNADLLIGGTSTATLQSALLGTPAIALNLSGFEWPYPLGGETAVPVARTREALVAALDGFAREGTLPGREDMLAALGASGGNHPAAIARIAAAARVRPAA